MNNLLTNVLNSRGVGNVTQLSAEEKVVFDRWEKILSEGEVSVESISLFCKNQISLIEAQWKNLDNSQEKNQRLILLHTVYSAIEQAISGPKVERENLEKYLNSLL